MRIPLRLATEKRTQISHYQSGNKSYPVYFTALLQLSIPSAPTPSPAWNLYSLLQTPSRFNPCFSGWRVGGWTGASSLTWRAVPNSTLSSYRRFSMADKVCKFKAFRTDPLIAIHMNTKTGFHPEWGHCLMSMFHFSSFETDPFIAVTR